MVRSLGICSASYLSAMAWSMVSGAPYEPMPPKATVMPLSMSLAASSFVILFISDPPFLKYGFMLLMVCFFRYKDPDRSYIFISQIYHIQIFCKVKILYAK